MQVTKATIYKIADQIRNYLSQGHFAYVSINETYGCVETFSTGHRLNASWTDRSEETVRVMPYNDGANGQLYIGFSISGWYFVIEEGQSVSVSGEGVKIRFTAPCGDNRCDWLKLEHQGDDD